MNAESKVRPSSNPYIEIFKQIELMLKCQPVDAYSKYREFLDINKLDPCIYLSMAITSGGFSRNSNLRFDEAMEMNADFGTQTAQLIADELSALDITQQDIVLPSDLGKVESWGQAEYLTFWAHVICGLDPVEAKQLDAYMRRYHVENHPGFIASGASTNEKWQANKFLVDTFVESLETLHLAEGQGGAKLPKNMQAVVLILDAIKSLGVNTERYLCHRLGLGEYSIVLNSHSPSYKEKISALQDSGADTLTIIEDAQSPIISGNVNITRHQRLVEAGVRFRKTGILMGILERKAIAVTTPPPIIPPTNEQLWREYYQYN